MNHRCNTQLNSIKFRSSLFMSARARAHVAALVMGGGALDMKKGPAFAGPLGDTVLLVGVK